MPRTPGRATDEALLSEVERRAAGAGRQWKAEDFEPIALALARVLPALAAA